MFSPRSFILGCLDVRRRLAAHTILEVIQEDDRRETNCFLANVWAGGSRGLVLFVCWAGGRPNGGFGRPATSLNGNN